MSKVNQEEWISIVSNCIFNRYTNRASLSSSGHKFDLDTIQNLIIDAFKTRNSVWCHNPDHEDTPESAFEKISHGWNGLNGYPAEKEIIIGFGSSSYLHLCPDGTYSYYETAT